MYATHFDAGWMNPTWSTSTSTSTSTYTRTWYERMTVTRLVDYVIEPSVPKEWRWYHRFFRRVALSVAYVDALLSRSPLHKKQEPAPRVSVRRLKRKRWIARMIAL